MDYCGQTPITNSQNEYHHDRKFEYSKPNPISNHYRMLSRGPSKWLSELIMLGLSFIFVTIMWKYSAPWQPNNQFCKLCK